MSTHQEIAVESLRRLLESLPKRTAGELVDMNLIQILGDRLSYSQSNEITYHETSLDWTIPLNTYKGKHELRLSVEISKVL